MDQDLRSQYPPGLINFSEGATNNNMARETVASPVDDRKNTLDPFAANGIAPGYGPRGPGTEVDFYHAMLSYMVHIIYIYIYIYIYI